MAENTDIKNWLLGIAGAIAGGVVGYFATAWILSQGFYALALPGALLGLGCGRFSGMRSPPLGIVCGVAGLALGLMTDWMLRPFIADDSLVYYLTHLSDLKPFTMMMIVLGGYFGWSFGRRGYGGGRPRRSSGHVEDE